MSKTTSFDRDYPYGQQFPSWRGHLGWIAGHRPEQLAEEQKQYRDWKQAVLIALGRLMPIEGVRPPPRRGRPYPYHG